MELILAHLGNSRARTKDGFGILTASYIERCRPLIPCQAMGFRTEQDFRVWLNRAPGRIPPIIVLLDSHGRQMSSEAFASWIGHQRDQGVRQLVFAIGPADGWSDETRSRAQLLLSLGPLTMAHALARLVLAEQLYRACTILAGHPYHTGH